MDSSILIVIKEHMYITQTFLIQWENILTLYFKDEFIMTEEPKLETHAML